MTKKVITPASGSTQTIYYETNDENTVLKLSAGGNIITSSSNNDSFVRKEFDELQLATGVISRKFTYYNGEVTDEHKDNAKVKSAPTTQLVKQIEYSDGRTISYEYDAEERITKITDSIDGVTEYTYDAQGQLLTETVNGNLVNTMTYDGYGNIASKNGKFYTYDYVWKDQLVCYDAQCYMTYDAQGNPLTYLGHTLTWEKGRQLKSFDGNTYTYNANGIRTSKTANGVLHTYTLDGTKILRETWDGNTLIPLYDNEEGVCGILYNNIPYYFIKNLQGDVIAIVDKDAQTVARYSYDAWGAVTSAITYTELTKNVDIATINPFRYRCYYYDEEIGLYYLQSRYYDANICRFINDDEIEVICIDQTIISEKNIFCYCKNNCVMLLDKFGYKSSFTFPSWIVGTIIDMILLTIPYFGIAFAPIKAAAKAGGKLVAKKIAAKASEFLKTLIKYSSKILYYVRKILRNIPKLGRKVASKITLENLFGSAFSMSTNTLIKTFIPYLYILLSVGGFIEGMWDHFSDGKINGKIVIRI